MIRDTGNIKAMVIVKQETDLSNVKLKKHMKKLKEKAKQNELILDE